MLSVEENNMSSITTRKRHIHNKEKMLLERELELIQLLLKRSDC